MNAPNVRKLILVRTSVWKWLAFLEPTANESQEILSENVIVPHKYRQVKIAPNTEITIDIEDIKKEIEQAIAKQAKLYGDFFKSCT